MKKIFCLIIAVLIIGLNSSAQNIDSLKLALKNAKHDTTRCNILNILSETASDEEWPNFNNQLLILSESKLKNLSPSHSDYKFYKKCAASAINNVGYIYSLQGDFSNALIYYGKALKLREEISDKKGIANSFNNIGFVYNEKGEISKSLEYSFKSLKVQEEIGDKNGIAYSLNNIGAIYKDLGDTYKALECYKKSLKIMEEIGDRNGIAGAFNNIGYIYQFQGDIPMALLFYGKSLKLKEEIGDKRGFAIALNNISYIYHDQGDIKNASEYLSKSLKIYEVIGDKQSLANALANFGNIYREQRNFPQALEYLNKSVKIQEQIGDKNGTANSLIGIGIIYFDQGNLPKALEYYSQAVKLMDEISDKQGIANALNHIGFVYLKQKAYADAIKSANRSMELCKELGYVQNIRNTAKLLNEIYKATGNHKLALENYELYIQMRDSSNNIETQKATIKQQSKYEYDKQKAVEDEKHTAELKMQDEKAQADKTRQNIIIGSVSVVLILVAIFSVLLFNRFKTTQKQKQIIEVKEKETQQQKHVIEEKQKEIIDSINYAKRIQYTLLAHENFLKEHLSEHFTFFNPKDIVSGDFYWATRHNDKFYLAVCDSTGHGVPGAFMSLLNIGFLTEAINEKGIEKPNEVFDFVRMKLTHTISKEGQKDGFDGILVCFDSKTRTITYAAANNAPILVQNEQFVELSADRMPVGVGERKENFTLHTIEANKGDMLYLYTDGYADQFGGSRGKKFKYKQLNELLLALHSKPLTEQYFELKNSFDNWRGELEQVDDVCIIGIKI